MPLLLLSHMWVPPFLARPSHYTSAPNDRTDACHLGGTALVSRVENRVHTRLLPKDRKEGWVIHLGTPTCPPDEQAECAAQSLRKKKKKSSNCKTVNK